MERYAFSMVLIKIEEIIEKDEIDSHLGWEIYMVAKKLDILLKKIRILDNDLQGLWNYFIGKNKSNVFFIKNTILLKENKVENAINRLIMYSI